MFPLMDIVHLAFSVYGLFLYFTLVRDDIEAHAKLPVLSGALLVYGILGLFIFLRLTVTVLVYIVGPQFLKWI